MKCIVHNKEVLYRNKEGNDFCPECIDFAFDDMSEKMTKQGENLYKMRQKLEKPKRKRFQWVKNIKAKRALSVLIFISFLVMHTILAYIVAVKVEERYMDPEKFNSVYNYNFSSDVKILSEFEKPDMVIDTSLEDILNAKNVEILIIEIRHNSYPGEGACKELRVCYMANDGMLYSYEKYYSTYDKLIFEPIDNTSVKITIERPKEFKTFETEVFASILFYSVLTVGGLVVLYIFLLDDKKNEECSPLITSFIMGIVITVVFMGIFIF